MPPRSFSIAALALSVATLQATAASVQPEHAQPEHAQHAASATGAPQTPHTPGTTQPSCAPPRFTVSDLRVGDGALDRGWPGGVSLADVDGDGDLDLTATRGYDVTNRDPEKQHPDRSMLYLNDGAGRFSHALESDLSKAENYASGSTWGDVDGDGDLDAFVSTQLGQKDAFYRNHGGGKLVREELGDATATAGSNFSSTWADIDGDGDLDLYVGGPMLSMAEPNLVYRNDGGRFVRVTGTPLENGKSNAGAVLWADLDGDGDQDLFVANSDILRRNDIAPAEIETPTVYRNDAGGNDGAWRFTRLGPQGFDALEYSANVAALGDVDDDGDLDLFLGLFAGPQDTVRDRLLLNDGKGIFTEAAALPGAEHVQLATGAAFADLDLDGDLDLVSTSYGSGIRVHVNDGHGTFSPLAQVRPEDRALAERKSSHWSIATGDLDGDGDLDAVIGNWGEVAAGEFATLLRNDTARCGDSVYLALFDRNGAPDPPGARVTLITRTATGEERRRLREASAQTTVRGQGASFFLFGVPRAETIVRAEVRWPDGTVQVVEDLPRNGRVEVRAGAR
jgi:hypothetical protein